VQALFDRLVLELEKPRPLTAQVLRHLTDTYDLGRDEAGAFLDERLAGLEDDEIDLILSPLFTPKLADQTVFALLLGQTPVPPAEWPGLVQRLAARPTLGCVTSEDGSPHRFPLRPVTLERFVHRLRLEGTISDPLFRLIQSLPPAEDRPLLLAVARRAIWNTPARQDILLQYLSASVAGENYRREDAAELLALMETSEPSGIPDLLARLPAWLEVVRGQISDAGRPKVFFNDQVQELHGGGRDQRTANEQGISRKQAELAFLERLKGTFSSGR